MATLEEWQASQSSGSSSDSGGDFNFGSEDSGWLA